MLYFARQSGRESLPATACHVDGYISNRVRLSGDGPAADESTPDSDFLLARYRRLGEAFLDGVEGAFAVTLFDADRQVALVARDGMGNRSISYVLRDGFFAAGPSDAELADLPGLSGALNPLRLAEFFSNEETSGPDTFFQDVRELLPGELLVVGRESIRRRHLRRPRPALWIDLPRWEDYVERFTELLESAVAADLPGIQRAAVLLSGGLDSTPVAAHAARLLKTPGGASPITALTWRVTDPDGDERPYASAAADWIGLPLEWIDCDDAEPFGSIDLWPVNPSTPEQGAYRWFHQRSYARARELGYRVLLGGFSGDTLYGNARRWFWDLAAGDGFGRAMDSLRQLAAARGWRSALRSEVIGGLLPRTRGLRRRIPGGLTPAARALLEGRGRWPPGVEEARRPRQAERVLSLLDAHGDQVERWYAGGFGLDLRNPLRNLELVEFMLGAPDHLLRRGDETRPVLREACRGLIPEIVRGRPGKASYLTLFQRGLDRQGLGWARTLLSQPEALWRDFVEPETVESWLAGPSDGDRMDMGLIQCIFAELWRIRRRTPAANPAALDWVLPPRSAP